MDDIGLWKSLTGSIDEDAAALAERLTELSQRSITDRWPFFGLISPLLKDNNARLRRTAVEVLAGANGRPALNTLIACLRDKDADVRSAAVAALGQSLDDDPLRFAHVFFHPDADVRREALQSEPNSKSDWMQIYLIADPELRSAILPRLDEISLPGRVLPVITDFAERKLLTEKQARFLISRMLLRDWQTWVDHGRIRPEESRREVLNDARRLKPDDPLPAVGSILGQPA